MSIEPRWVFHELRRRALAKLVGNGQGGENCGGGRKEPLSMVPQEHTECGVRSATLTIPELEQSKAAVLNTLASAHSRRSYAFAIDRFIAWYCSEIASHSEACKRGLLRAVFDPQIGAALKSLHEKLEHHWTVESLAAVSGMSRSAFAVRFKDLVGETPLEYLTSWRMQKATRLLQKGDKKLFEVAKSVGYYSDASFSKAFKRAFGVAPREFRRNATAE